jgi:DNA polymerase III epsilon subunit-like protein
MMRLLALLNPFKWRRYHQALKHLTCLAIDVETGGLEPTQHALLQVGVVAVVNGEIVDVREWNVTPHPSTRMDKQALEVNGWTRDRLLDSISEFELIQQLALFINRTIPSDRYTNWLGHHVEFDMRFMRAAAVRALGKTESERIDKIFNTKVVYCTAVFGAGLRAAGRWNHSLQLDGMLRVIGLPERSGHHSALEDAHCALAVWKRLLWEAA